MVVVSMGGEPIKDKPEHPSFIVENGRRKYCVISGAQFKHRFYTFNCHCFSFPCVLVGDLCLYGAESPEIVEGRQRNTGQVQRLIHCFSGRFDFVKGLIFTDLHMARMIVNHFFKYQFGLHEEIAAFCL